jgi:hypothetical protein
MSEKKNKKSKNRSHVNQKSSDEREDNNIKAMKMKIDH